MKIFNCKNLLLGSLLLIPLLFDPFTGDVEGIKLVFFGLLSIVLWIFNDKPDHSLKNPIIWMLCVIIVVGGLSIIFSADIYTSFFGASDRRLGFLTYIFFVLLALNFPKIKSDELRRFFVISGSATSLVALIFGFLLNAGLFEGRIGGTLGNPNFLGQFISVTVFLNVYELINAKKKKIYLYPSLAIQFFTLLMTGNRASILALIVGILLYSLLTNGKRIYALFVGLISSGLAFLFIDRLTSSQSLITRFELYSSSLKAIAQNLWLGAGFEQIQYALDVQSKYSLIADRVHQFYLDATLSAGIFFGLALLGLSAFVLKKLYKEKDFFYAFLIMLLSLQFGFIDVFGLFLFAIFVGVAIRQKLPATIELE